ncbi:purine-nucleoside phosphorylase, DeoD family [Sphaerochaeta pleomorpha str. Grapes]|uniref:Uridine phosphorylase n=1 Tax=Sphaerochaeta pleomorpha (strain ATCC BAA-1885 / DSM 22778 / Grapes) TaxID=158190 RepID=G8QRV4_SPHPG|nr:purine-nucleoside phosphorylase [Sphaerochaeta pleomorpha]AEV28887.1 purine-nucleoside phosphorylase, DeoD family [Sphaerochaeta pleomorpha str. Grapes]
MTPHNRAKKGDIAKIVLAPGDPLRAKLVAEKFLDQSRLVTDVRNVLGYTGLYKGKEVSVLSTGMGGPSIGIYSYELYNEYEVEAIIRIGTCGGLQSEVGVGDLVFAMTASTDSAWAHQYNLKGTLSPCCDSSLLLSSIQTAQDRGFTFHAGMVFSSDLFSSYNALGEDSWRQWARLGALAQDMETYALYSTAAWSKKKAFSILTMTDSCVSKEGLADTQRIPALYPMIETALETAWGML